MARYFHFVVVGCVLGLFTEALFKLGAGMHPEQFVFTVFAYPVILTGAFAGGALVNRLIKHRLWADGVTYFASGMCGLVIEWTLLGNPPGSNASQLGMFAMWTTFCFGPRVLTRPSTRAMRRWFWGAFWAVAVVSSTVVLIIPSPEARLVVAVVSMVLSNLVWTVWLLVMAWRTRLE